MVRGSNHSAYRFTGSQVHLFRAMRATPSVGVRGARGEVQETPGMEMIGEIQAAGLSQRALLSLKRFLIHRFGFRSDLDLTLGPVLIAVIDHFALD